MRTLSLSLLAIGTCASAQVIFQTTYDGPLGMYDSGGAVIQTSDGGYAAAGITSGTNVFDGLLVRFNATGDTLWSKTYDLGGTFEYLTDLYETDDGGFMLCGILAYAEPEGGPILIRTDAQGDTLWTQHYPAYSGYDQDAAMTRLANGRIAITGQINGETDSPPDMYTLIVDADGAVIGSNSQGYAWRDAGHDVAQLTNGGMVVVGETRLHATDSSDMAMWFFDDNGSIIGTMGYGFPEEEGIPDNITAVAYAIEPCQAGGFVVAGMATDPTIGDTNAVFIRVSPAYEFLWTLVLGGVGRDIGEDVAECASGNFSLLWTSGSDPYRKWNVSTVDENGQLLETVELGGEDDYTTASCIIAASDGNPVVTGILIDGGIGSGNGVLDLHLTKVWGSCTPVSVGVLEQPKEEVLAWPSPFNDLLTIKAPSGPRLFLLQITDALGRTLVTRNLLPDSRYDWNVSSKISRAVEPGVYFVSLIADGQRYTQRVIKQ